MHNEKNEIKSGVEKSTPEILAEHSQAIDNITLFMADLIGGVE